MERAAQVSMIQSGHRLMLIWAIYRGLRASAADTPKPVFAAPARDGHLRNIS
jgi:hypothetical protein